MNRPLDNIVNPATGAPAGQQPPQQPQQQPPQQGKPPEAPATPAERAASAGSPKTEGDQSSADAVLYEIPFGENDTRKFTPSQIKGMHDRYTAMNHEHMRLKPVMDMAKAAMQQNPNMTAEQLVQRLVQIAQGQGQAQPSEGNPSSGTNEDISAKLQKWEKDNAASLPPGYAEMLTGQGQMSQMMGNMMRMMQTIMAGTHGMADAARHTAQQSSKQMADATLMSADNNVRMLMQKVGLTPEQSMEDFHTFAAERGYIRPELANPMVAATLVQDYLNALNGPEIGRLRDMAKRRQAFTGSLQQVPNGGMQGDGGEVDKKLETMIDRRMK